MISFTKKELEAIALLSPVVANSNKLNVDELIAKAHRERSAYITGLVAGAFKKIAAAYRSSRQNSIAIAQLHAMSGRELADIGVARSEIKQAVLGHSAAKTPVHKKVTGLIATVNERLAHWRQARSGYTQLMAMDARQLSDIGLTRGDIAAAIAGKSVAQANDNAVAAANNNGGRKVS